MTVKRERARAVLTLKDADKLDARYRRRLAKWLTRTAEFLVSREVKKHGLSKRFTARYLEM